MRGLLLSFVLLAGCSSAALPDPQEEAPDAPPPIPSFQCVWHFTAPNDTSDSDQTPTVATCDGEYFSLADSMISVDASRDGVVMINGCRASVTPAGSGATFWFLGVSGCDADGLIGVNVR